MSKQKQSAIEDIEAHEPRWGNWSPLYKLFKGKKWDKDNLSCKKKKNWEVRENIEILYEEWWRQIFLGNIFLITSWR